MILLDGKSLSEQILSNLKADISRQSRAISLHVILIGDDPSSLKYVALKGKKCQEIGVNFVLHHLPLSTPQPEVEALIYNLNQDNQVTGFFVQLPLPAQLNKDLILSKISVDKDVDGLNPSSSFTPAVVVGIIKLLSHYHLDFSNKSVVILNDSDLIGQPLKKHFPQAVLCNDHTIDLSIITKTADLLISATGVKKIVTANMVKNGATVVDVASGDVDFNAVASHCSYITPTFGGIGPMTVASLLYNLCSQGHLYAQK